MNYLSPDNSILKGYSRNYSPLKKTNSLFWLCILIIITLIICVWKIDPSPSFRGKSDLKNNLIY